MSEAVQLAIVAAVQSWGNSLFENLSGIVPAVGTALIAVMTWRYNQKSEERAAAIRSKVESVRTDAILSSQQAEDIAAGRERRGYANGIKIEQQRASDQAELRSTFEPLKTDVFMARGGPDHNDIEKLGG